MWPSNYGRPGYPRPAGFQQRMQTPVGGPSRPPRPMHGFGGPSYPASSYARNELSTAMPGLGGNVGAPPPRNPTSSAYHPGPSGFRRPSRPTAVDDAEQDYYEGGGIPSYSRPGATSDSYGHAGRPSARSESNWSNPFGRTDPADSYSLHDRAPGAGNREEAELYGNRGMGTIPGINDASEPMGGNEWERGNQYSDLQESFEGGQFCADCDLQFADEKSYNQHCLGLLHKKRMRDIEEVRARQEELKQKALAATVKAPARSILKKRTEKTESMALEHQHDSYGMYDRGQPPQYPGDPSIRAGSRERFGSQERQYDSSKDPYWQDQDGHGHGQGSETLPGLGGMNEESFQDGTSDRYDYPRRGPYESNLDSRGRQPYGGDIADADYLRQDNYRSDALRKESPYDYRRDPYTNEYSERSSVSSRDGSYDPYSRERSPAIPPRPGWEGPSSREHSRDRSPHFPLERERFAESPLNRKDNIASYPHAEGDRGVGYPPDRRSADYPTDFDHGDRSGAYRHGSRDRSPAFPLRNSRERSPMFPPTVERDAYASQVSRERSPAIPGLGPRDEQQYSREMPPAGDERYDRYDSGRERDTLKLNDRMDIHGKRGERYDRRDYPSDRPDDRFDRSSSYDINSRHAPEGADDYFTVNKYSDPGHSRTINETVKDSESNMYDPWDRQQSASPTKTQADFWSQPGKSGAGLIPGLESANLPGLSSISQSASASAIPALPAWASAVDKSFSATAVTAENRSSDLFLLQENLHEMKAKETYCRACEIKITGVQNLNFHFQGKKHIKSLLMKLEKEDLDPLAFCKEFINPEISAPISEHFPQNFLKVALATETFTGQNSVMSKEERNDYKDFVLKSGSKNGFYCEVCSRSLFCVELWVIHVVGEKHAKKCVEILAELGRDGFMNRYSTTPGPNPETLAKLIKDAEAKAEETEKQAAASAVTSSPLGAPQSIPSLAKPHGSPQLSPKISVRSPGQNVVPVRMTRGPNVSPMSPGFRGPQMNQPRMLFPAAAQMTTFSPQTNVVNIVPTVAKPTSQPPETPELLAAVAGVDMESLKAASQILSAAPWTKGNEETPVEEHKPTSDSPKTVPQESTPVEKVEETPVDKVEEAPVDKVEETPADKVEEHNPPQVDLNAILAGLQSTLLTLAKQTQQKQEEAERDKLQNVILEQAPNLSNDEENKNVERLSNPSNDASPNYDQYAETLLDLPLQKLAPSKKDKEEETQNLPENQNKPKEAPRIVETLSSASSNNMPAFMTGLGGGGFTSRRVDKSPDNAGITAAKGEKTVEINEAEATDIQKREVKRQPIDTRKREEDALLTGRNKSPPGPPPPRLPPSQRFQAEGKGKDKTLLRQGPSWAQTSKAEAKAMATGRNLSPPRTIPSLAPRQIHSFAGSRNKSPPRQKLSSSAGPNINSRNKSPPRPIPTLLGTSRNTSPPRWQSLIQSSQFEPVAGEATEDAKNTVITEEKRTVSRKVDEQVMKSDFDERSGEKPVMADGEKKEERELTYKEIMERQKNKGNTYQKAKASPSQIQESRKVIRQDVDYRTKPVDMDYRKVDVDMRAPPQTVVFNKDKDERVQSVHTPTAGGEERSVEVVGNREADLSENEDNGVDMDISPIVEEGAGVTPAESTLENTADVQEPSTNKPDISEADNVDATPGKSEREASGDSHSKPVPKIRTGMSIWQRNQLRTILPASYIPSQIEKFYDSLVEAMELLITKFREAENYSLEELMNLLPVGEHPLIYSIRDMTGTTSTLVAARVTFVLRGMDQDIVRVLGRADPALIQSLVFNDAEGHATIKNLFATLRGDKEDGGLDQSRDNTREQSKNRGRGGHNYNRGRGWGQNQNWGRGYNNSYNRGRGQYQNRGRGRGRGQNYNNRNNDYGRGRGSYSGGKRPYRGGADNWGPPKRAR